MMKEREVNEVASEQKNMRAELSQLLAMNERGELKELMVVAVPTFPRPIRHLVVNDSEELFDAVRAVMKSAE